MRIIHLTPGTGNFHCGSCLRDHALVRALGKLGHEMTLVPLYLPMVTDDEKEETKVPLFLGGINMYLQQKFRLFRWTPKWLDRFFDRESLLMGLIEKAGMTRARDLGEMTVSSFKGSHGEQRKEVNKLITWLKKQPKPDLISFSNGLLSGVARSVHEELKVPVVCSLQGEDSFIDTLPEPYRRQSWELFRDNSAFIARYIAVSNYYADVMRKHLELTDRKVLSVHNGIDFTPFHADQSKRLDPPVIGYLARMCMGKGLHTLVDAFIDLRQRDTVHCKLHLAGAKTVADDEFIAQQKQKLDSAGLLDDVEFSPNLSTNKKVEFLQSLSVFSVPALYGESFGLYLIEALACDVPVVQPNHAAFPEILERTGGGLLYDPEDPTNLADSLEVMLSLEERRRKLGFEGGQGARKYFTADRMAAEISEIFETVAKTA
ncbi:glycosyltransferase family 4 protein [Verrucomicrobiales bacterium]|nr:glycosyltransferase family 4 protein [bacterium]MDC0312436.1 glycosyltransferase family 4 protein [Verrucomicrobiales bacterium]